MIEIKDKKECCGCYGCENICPKNAIKMVDDNEGFWYPKVSEDICIKCGLCEKVCPTKNRIDSPNKNITEYYACKNKQIGDRLNSSSGGVFNLLSNYIIERKGIVFGVAFDENFNLRHRGVSKKEECEQFKGSKYLQSRVENTYSKVKEALEDNKYVLFSGTQCQIKGLNLFLRKTYNKLLTVEIICHGVPSPKVHKQYLKIKSKEYNSEIKKVKFRDKKLGWKKFSYSLEFENGKKYSESLEVNIFMQGFLKNVYLRPSCYSCKSKNFTSGADISLADYWGVQNIHPEFDDDKGTSLVLASTKKGKEVLNLISEQMDIIETNGEFAIQNNSCIVRPVQYNPKREKFFADFERIDLIRNIENNTKVSFLQKVKIKIYSILLRLKRIIKK